MYQPILNHLRDRRRLHVVAVEVALEVEIREDIAIRDREELLERRVGLDVVLVLQVLLLHVAVDRLRDLRAGHERAGRLAEERAELVRDLRRALKDGRDAGLRLRALRHCAALALARILDVAVDTLVELLHLREHRRDRLAERREVLRNGLEVLLERGRGRGRGSDNRLDGRGCDNDRRGGGRGGDLLGRLLGGLSNDGCGDGSRCDRGGGGGLRGNLLCGGLGGGGRHYTGD